ncbi:hypothetical protein CPC08DRAFT_806521 [Agrocybe pediades]|nr:hypothetical protein CPC08DRAFT_806521 [Agrocybe pediades]
MVVESALLYTISHVVTVGLLVKVSPDFNFSQNILVQMAGISPTLLLLRVCIGRHKDTMRGADMEMISGMPVFDVSRETQDIVMESATVGDPDTTTRSYSQIRVVATLESPLILWSIMLLQCSDCTTTQISRLRNWLLNGLELSILGHYETPSPLGANKWHAERFCLFGAFMH